MVFISNNHEKKKLKQLSDEQLMLDVSQGNLDAMAVIFERYHLRIYNFFFQMIRDRAISEDLTQNVFYKAIRYRSSYKGGKFVSWIFKIARNIFADQYQKQKLEQNNIKIDRMFDADGELLLDRDEDIAHLHNALKKLKVKERELIVLNRFQGIKYDRIAEITGSNEGAVKVKIHRIIKKLRAVYFEKI